MKYQINNEELTLVDYWGKDYNKISNQVAGLKQLGYECSMIFVNTSLDTALEQNKKRKNKILYGYIY